MQFTVYCWKKPLKFSLGLPKKQLLSFLKSQKFCIQQCWQNKVESLGRAKSAAVASFPLVLAKAAETFARVFVRKVSINGGSVMDGINSSWSVER